VNASASPNWATFVRHVDEQATVRAAVQGAAQSATDHLLIRVRRIDGTRDVERSNPRCVEARRQNVEVRDDPQGALPEPVDVVAS
jgi:hypothetical protein